MTDVLIVGGGPAGLSAALFTAKNDLDTVVFDTDGTWMHKAHLFNYLGIESEDGTQFVEGARAQVDDFGAERREEQVTGVEETADGFTVSTEDDEHEAPTSCWRPAPSVTSPRVWTVSSRTRTSSTWT